ncbi:helix-turn-helix transcriptional regulator [Pinibacter soli]|uniref:Helix-turn-helix transcriptional regulator n=1 Tax=Pinibacter soli TaxID=3044211 RepID=A0ABT6RHD5_9BACT|nr:helix-turn-helix transcriptional regulator [Pinibacter soli]MDI3321970.1 helix-turn-helix transcriptional regulator [Pinibacter soli]
MEKTIHHGRNIKRFREVFGLKQEGLAYELGDDWDQRKVSALEQKEVVDPKILEEVAKALKIPVAAIENFDEEQAVHIIANTVNNNDHATGNALYSYCPTFNPLDELLKSLEENKKLYERLLQSEKDKVEMLQEVLKKIK